MDLVDKYLTQLSKVLADLPRDQIWRVVEALMNAWQRRARIFLLGNGGSAATASHMANDLSRLTIVPERPRFRAIALTDNVPLITAWGNDSAYEDIFAEQLLNLLDPGDVVIGLSTSGNSPNVLKALQIARKHGATTIGLTGQDGGKLKDLVDHCIFVPSDHIGQQEDVHMVLDHVISGTLRQLIEKEGEERLRGLDTRSLHAKRAV